MLGFFIIRQLWQIERDQLVALEGTHDDLPSITIVYEDRRDQVGEHRLQQESGNQRPGDDRRS